MPSKRATKRQAESTLRAIKKQFKSWIDAGTPGPTLVMDWDWFGAGPSPAILWEEGPYQWTYLVPDGGTDEEFGFKIEPTKIPTGVWTEPATSWALHIWPKDW